jgi:division/cell wall cluster transcriptional repressor MraZ
MDVAGRITLPESFLISAGQKPIMLLHGLDGQIHVYQYSAWEALVDRQNEMMQETGLEDLRHSMRFLFAATECEVDGKGRALVPPTLRRFSDLQADIVAIEKEDHLELWNPEQFDGYVEGAVMPVITEALASSRGIELSEEQIKRIKQVFSPTLSQKTLRNPSHVFVCHSSRDKPFVRRLASDLRQAGIKVWFDEWEMLPGDSLYSRIQHGILQAGYFAIVLSPSSVGSPWCARELHAALEEELNRRRVFVVPILYQTCEIPPFLKEKIYADLTSRNYRKGLARLLQRFTYEDPSAYIT